MRARAVSPGFRASSRTAVGGNDGGDALVADASTTLARRPSTTTSRTVPSNWFPAADARRSGWAAGSGQELRQCVQWDTVVAAGSLDGADAPGQDPVLEHRVADASFSAAWRGVSNVEAVMERQQPPSPVLYTAAMAGRRVRILRLAALISDCNHSTSANSDDRLPRGLYPEFRGPRLLEPLATRLQT